MKIAITTSSFGASDTAPLDRLKSAGLEIVFNPYGRQLTSDEAKDVYEGLDGVIAGTEVINDDLLIVCPTLKVISRLGSGIDNVQVSNLPERNIQLMITPGGPTQAVAELTLGLILDLLRRISLHDRQMRNGVWKKHSGNLMEGKVLGIVGLGRIGRKVVELVKPFNLKILAWDAAPLQSFVDVQGIKMVSLEAIFEESDIVTLHLPFEADLGNLIDDSLIRRMKQTAYFVNAARGPLVDEEALYSALSEKRIAGAALDVYNNEPYQGPFTTLENTVLTSHIGSAAQEARILMEAEAVDNLLKGLGLV